MYGYFQTRRHDRSFTRFLSLVTFVPILHDKRGVLGARRRYESNVVVDTTL